TGPGGTTASGPPPPRSATTRPRTRARRGARASGPVAGSSDGCTGSPRAASPERTGRSCSTPRASTRAAAAGTSRPSARARTGAPRPRTARANRGRSTPDEVAREVPQALIGLGRPRVRLGRPPCELVVLGVGHRLRTAGHGGEPDQRRQAGGHRDERLDPDRFWHELPLLLELARERLRRVLAHLDGAACAECPAAGPAREPVGPAARQPVPAGVADHAESGHAARALVIDE